MESYSRWVDNGSGLSLKVGQGRVHLKRRALPGGLGTYDRSGIRLKVGLRRISNGELFQVSVRVSVSGSMERPNTFPHLTYFRVTIQEPSKFHPLPDCSVKVKFTGKKNVTCRRNLISKSRARSPPEIDIGIEKGNVLIEAFLAAFK